MNPSRCGSGVFVMLLVGSAILSLHAMDAEESEREYRPKKVLRNALPPIVDGKFLLAAKVDREVLDNELVLGVVVNGEARAYPINMLTGPSREIINDTLGGVAIAATW